MNDDQVTRESQNWIEELERKTGNPNSQCLRYQPSLKLAFWL